MGRPKVSVVLATYNRAHLLKRSLMRYSVQNLKDIELVIVDDWSVDETEALVKDWSSALNIVYIRPPYKKPGVWRDTASVINNGLRAATGEVVLMTHPEVLVGDLTLSAMYEHRQPMVYHSAKIYYLTPDDQRNLDQVAWELDLLKVRELPGFYEAEKSPEFRGNADYTHAATDRHTHWESWVFGGFIRDTWRDYGTMTEFTQWGSVDVDFLQRRAAANIVTRTELAAETFCVHQNHDTDHGVFVKTDRSGDPLAGLPQYRSSRDALKGPLW